MNINAKELIAKINANDPEFRELWEQEIGKKNPKENTIRAKILENYLSNPDGEFKDVMLALKENGFKIRRKEYPIYGLKLSMYKETPDDELESIVSRDIVQNIYSFNYIDETSDRYPELKTKIENHTKAFLENREMFGRDIEAHLLHVNYALGDLESAKQIVRTGDRLPYSSTSVKQLLDDIIRGDDIESLKELIDANPVYWEDITKVVARSFNHKMPEANNYTSSYDKKSKIINLNVLARAVYEGEDVFNYLVKKFDFNMDGSVITGKNDWENDPNNNGGDWKKSLFNSYQSEKVPYTSDDDFIRKVPSSLASIIFCEYLSLTDEQKKEDTQLKSFLEACIKQGSFNEVMKAKINYWGETKKLSELGVYKYGEHKNFSSGNCNAYEVFMEFEDIRAFVYKNSVKIMESLNTSQKNDFFSNLLKYSTTKEKYHKTVVYSYEKKEYPYSLSREVPESKFEYVIDNLGPFLPKVHYFSKASTSAFFEYSSLKSKINQNDVATKVPENINLGISCVKFLEENINYMDNKELKKFLKFNQEYEHNLSISHPGVKFDLSIVGNKSIFLSLLKNDFTENGKSNPMQHLITTEGVQCLSNTRRYFAQTPQDSNTPDEIKEILKSNAKNKEIEENRMKTAISSIQYLMDLSLKNNSLSLPILHTIDYRERASNPLAALLLEWNAANVIVPALEDRHIKAFLNNNLFDNPEDTRKEITTALYKCISKYTLHNSFKDDLSDDKVQLVNKIVKLLVNEDFKFTPNPENKEESYAYIKMLAMLDSEDTIKKIIGENQNVFRTIFNKYALDNFGEQKILNSLQSKNLMNVFSEGNQNFIKGEALFRETNSEETYKMFLDVAQPKIVRGKNDSLLLDAATNGQFNVVNAIIDYDPSSLREPTKTNRYCLEYVIKGHLKCKKDKSINSTETQKLQQIIEKIVDIGASEILDNKKSLENLSTTINNPKNDYTDMQVMKLNEYLLQHKIMKQALNNEEIHKNEPTIETSFKL